MPEPKQTLVSYKNFPYGIKRDGIFDVVPISEVQFNELQDTLPYEYFDNYYMPRMYLQITGKCNLRCKHCFSAVDNNPLLTEWSLEDARDLFRQARECGVCGVTMTGGEPTIHPHLIEILRSMRENDLFLLSFNTNGFNLKDELLEEFRNLGYDPNIKISLDGIGVHDDFRGVKGSEKRAMEALRRCKAAGFRVYTQTQVNKKTINAIPPLLDAVEDIGLTSVRLIKTTSTPRWEKNGRDDNFTFYEYFNEVYRLIEYQLQKGHRTDLDIWELAHVRMSHLSNSSLSLLKNHLHCDNSPLCPNFRKMISIGSDGRIYPCLEMQGVVNSFNYKFGSLKEQSLKEILEEGPYREIQKLTLADRRNHNGECVNCEYHDICKGGCPGLGVIYSGGDFLGVDKSCCEFFKTGMYEKYRKLFYGKEE